MTINPAMFAVSPIIPIAHNPIAQESGEPKKVITKEMIDTALKNNAAQINEINDANATLKIINTIGGLGVNLLALMVIGNYCLNFWDWSNSQDKSYYPLFGKTLGGPAFLPDVPFENGKAAFCAAGGISLSIIKAVCMTKIKENDLRKAMIIAKALV